MLLAKLALGFGGTLVLAGAYTFREGTIRVDVDEFREGGAHVHFWVPAAAIPMALHLAPKRHLEEAARHAAEWMPTAHVLLNELEKYPDTEFVDVEDHDQHVQIRTHAGKIQIDVDTPDEKVHLLCPLATIDDIASELASSAPGA
jgi:hypothetical protein